MDRDASYAFVVFLGVGKSIPSWKKIFMIGDISERRLEIDLAICVFFIRQGHLESFESLRYSESILLEAILFLELLHEMGV